MSSYAFITFDEIRKLLNWHKWLDENRGDRARLKRAERPDDILLTGAFFNFLEFMGDDWKIERPIFTCASIAGLLSHVKVNTETFSRINKPTDKKQPKIIASFAEQLATPVNNKPLLSEIRFQQLQKSRTTDEFYRRILRAIRKLDGKVNVGSMVNDIIHWHLEFHKNIDRDPAKRLAVSWATDYFSTLQLY